MLNRPVPYIALILFIQGAIILYRTRNSYFFFDDFFAFMIFKETGMTWEYLSRNVFQEWIPGYCFSMGLFYRLFGLSFSAARSIILSLSLLSTIFVFLISSRMKVTLWLSITCLIVYVFLIQLFHTQVWWSDSIRVLPALVATLGCLYVLIG